MDEYGEGFAPEEGDEGAPAAQAQPRPGRAQRAKQPAAGAQESSRSVTVGFAEYERLCVLAFLQGKTPRRWVEDAVSAPLPDPAEERMVKKLISIRAAQADEA